MQQFISKTIAVLAGLNMGAQAKDPVELKLVSLDTLPPKVVETSTNLVKQVGPSVSIVTEAGVAQAIQWHNAGFATTNFARLTNGVLQSSAGSIFSTASKGPETVLHLALSAELTSAFAPNDTQHPTQKNRDGRTIGNLALSRDGRIELLQVEVRARAHARFDNNSVHPLRLISGGPDSKQLDLVPYADSSGFDPRLQQNEEILAEYTLSKIVEVILGERSLRHRLVVMSFHDTSKLSAGQSSVWNSCGLGMIREGKDECASRLGAERIRDTDLKVSAPLNIESLRIEAITLLMANEDSRISDSRNILHFKPTPATNSKLDSVNSAQRASTFVVPFDFNYCRLTESLSDQDSLSTNLIYNNPQLLTSYVTTSIVGNALWYETELRASGKTISPHNLASHIRSAFVFTPEERQRILDVVDNSPTPNKQVIKSRITQVFKETDSFFSSVDLEAIVATPTAMFNLCMQRMSGVDLVITGFYRLLMRFPDADMIERIARAKPAFRDPSLRESQALLCIDAALALDKSEQLRSMKLIKTLFSDIPLVEEELRKH